MIHDTRFRRTLGASARVSYKTDRWLTPDEIEGRDKYQRMKAAQEFKEGTSEHQR
jgi:hypothetical protein